MTRKALSATYRIQFGPHFSFDDAAERASYFAGLGISHIYCSPIGQARPGSEHGYDGVDPTRIDPALGGEAGFRRMAAALAKVEIGLLIDIVPNHLAADADNPYWMDVLEFGADAQFAAVFDIDWSRRIVLPFLSDGAPAIAALRFDAKDGRILADVNGGVAPLRPGSVADLLQQTHPQALAETVALWRDLDSGPVDVARLEGARAALRGVVARDPQAFDAALATADLPAIADAQHWRAVDWHRTDELNYRRFFNVSHLVGVRIEDAAVFDMVHRLPLALLREGLVIGFRIDHIDGLADPEAYCRQLRDATGPDALLLVEKILGREEVLRDWPIEGTSGYERLNAISEVFIDPAGLLTFETHLREHGLLDGDAETRQIAAKAEVLRLSFTAELTGLAQAANAMLEGEGPDEASLQDGLLALVASFPVYRSYIASGPAGTLDQALWQQAVDRVAVHFPEAHRLAGQLTELALANPSDRSREFLRRFQQLTGPAMAKGFEDTELYRSLALTSRNEVGSDLAGPPLAAADLHAIASQFSPFGLTPLATHDTKRGADTRARIHVLSHRPQEWLDLVREWNAGHEAFKTQIDRNLAPDALDQWFIYQTLFGTWPISAERMEAYLTKALREAKRHSSWEEPNQAYEKACADFAARLIGDPAAEAFRADLEDFLGTASIDGRVFGLAQAILQLTLPGTPDIYQGLEFWDHSLVDPDNRRPVDWEPRRAALDSETLLRDLTKDEAGLSKAQVTRDLLQLRRRSPDLFAGPYQPIPMADGWFAFTRHSSSEELRVAVPISTTAYLSTSELTWSGGDGSDGPWQSVLHRMVPVSAKDGRTEVNKDFPFVVQLRSRSTE